MIGAALLGQFLSLTITVSGAVNEYLFRKYNVNFPALQTVLFYVLLSLVYLPRWLVTAKKNTGRSAKESVDRVWQARRWRYLAYSFLDFLAAVFVIKAYLYTNLAVVGLLSTVSTPCVILLSRAFLATKYRASQYVGALICVGGALFFSIKLGLDQNAGDAWLGGILALTSALVYAGSNVLAERMASSEDYDSDEFLGVVGAMGLNWSLVYLLLFANEEFALIAGQPLPVYGLLLVYALAIFGFYSVLPVFLRLSTATLFNLSLLTVNIYSAMVNILLFQDAFTWTFPIALVIVTIGILVYSF